MSTPPDPSSPDSAQPAAPARRRVAVVGGGYGGAAVAKALDEETDVVLIEPKDAFVHTTASLRALVDPDWAPRVFFPYDALLRRGRVVRERAASVGPGGVTLASGERVGADYVVLATGSRYPFPAKPDTDSGAEALERLRAAHKELAGADRVLILGAGPVGLELAGEIKAVWPRTHVTLVDPAAELLPGLLPQVRAELLRQLDELGVELLLGTALAAEPPTPVAVGGDFTVTTSDGRRLRAGLWFRCHGVRPDSDCLGPALTRARTDRGQIRVGEDLRVEGQERVYALGDVTAVAEAKMAGHALRHAEVVAANILAQVRGEEPAAAYRPAPAPSLLLPLGPRGGVGQFPGDARDPQAGPVAVSRETVAAYKGADLYVGRFEKLFGTG